MLVSVYHPYGGRGPGGRQPNEATGKSGGGS
jgi:hypothetical protein